MANRFTFYEFFAGAGLARLGLGTDWRCVWANDIDPRKAEVYTANFGAADLHLGDVSEIRAESLPPRADMAWASFPCQDLSLAGWRHGMTARRSGTFWAFWRMMRDLYDNADRPPVIALENVVGLLYGDGFLGLCESLAALGLQFGAVVVDAKRFLPQSRPRVFVVAADSRVDCGRFVESTPSQSDWFTSPVLRAAAQLPESIASLWRWWKLPVPQAPVAPLQTMIEDLPEAQWHAREETERLLGMMSPLNRAKVEQAASQPGRTVGLLYRRTRAGGQRAEVRFDGIAGCLRTPQGGSSRQTVVVAECGTVRTRLLAPREAARLMGVPDSYWLPPNYNNAYRAMGDAVAVPVVQWLSKHLLLPLAEACAAEQCGIRGASIGQSKQASLSRSAAEKLAVTWKRSHWSESDDSETASSYAERLVRE